MAVSAELIKQQEEKAKQKANGKKAAWPSTNKDINDYHFSGGSDRSL